MLNRFIHKMMIFALSLAFVSCAMSGNKSQGLNGTWKKVDSICDGGEPDEAVQYSSEMVKSGIVEDKLIFKGNEVYSIFFAWNGPNRTGSCTTETKQIWEFKNHTYRVKEFSLVSQKETGTEKCPPPLDTPSTNRWMAYEVNGNTLRFILVPASSQTSTDSSGTVTACGGGSWIDIYHRVK